MSVLLDSGRRAQQRQDDREVPEGEQRMVANCWYLCGSICFTVGTLINIWKEIL